MERYLWPHPDILGMVTAEYLFPWEVSALWPPPHLTLVIRPDCAASFRCSEGPEDPEKACLTDQLQGGHPSATIPLPEVTTVK